MLQKLLATQLKKSNLKYLWIKIILPWILKELSANIAEADENEQEVPPFKPMIIKSSS